MSEKTSKPKLNLNELKIVETSEIPPKATKGIWQQWTPILQGLQKTPTKAIEISENEASLPAIRNQIAKAIKSAKIENIIINTRKINKIQVLFISYKKQVKK